MTASPRYVRRGVERLSAYTPGEQPKEPGIVKLNTNENPYPPSPRVREALERLSVERLRLYPDPVCMELREQIASLHGCSAAQVFVGNGSDEVLALCVRAFAERDGTVGYFDPSYSLYPVLAAMEEIATKPVRLPADFTWTMPRGYTASLFFLTNPNAPTSMLFPKIDVARFCESFAGVVLIDEAYVDFSGAHCMDLALALPNVLVARTLSKSYSLAGLRLGYAVGSAPLIAALHKIKDSYNVSMTAQALASAALADQDHMRKNVERIRATRDRVSAELVRRGFAVCPSETNFLWVKPASMTAADLFAALRKKQILVRHFPGSTTGAYLRITVGTDTQMDALLAALEFTL